MDELSPWQQITDSILLQIFSSLDVYDLLAVSQTCKVWYRISQDETLWKGLVTLKLNKKVTLPEGKENWKSEYKRLVYHCPIHLSEDLDGHVDEIYHVTFSPSGKYISTTGKEGVVRLWKFGYPTEEISFNRLFTPPAYSRYSKFNQSETFLLVAGIVGAFSSQGAVGILSVENDLALLYYVTGEYPNFRGAWLDDNTFLNAGHYFDERTYFKLDAHKVPENPPKKKKMSTFECNSRGTQVLKTFPCNPRNDFVHIIDPGKWKARDLERLSVCDVDLETDSDDILCRDKKDLQSETMINDMDDVEDVDEDKLFRITEEQKLKDFVGLNQKIVLLCHCSRQLRYEGCMAFYNISSNSVNEVSTPFKTIELRAGILGVTLTLDHRYIVYSIRELDDQEEQHLFGGLYNINIQVRIYDLYQDCHLTTVCTGGNATSNSHLSYIFPDLSPDFVAGGSEYKYGHIWERHYGTHLQELTHKATSPHGSGVNAVAFHPQDQEVLVTVADDKIVKIWRSKNRIKTLPVKVSYAEKKKCPRKSGRKLGEKSDDKDDIEESGLDGDEIDGPLSFRGINSDSDSDHIDSSNSLVQCCYRSKHKK